LASVFKRGSVFEGQEVPIRPVCPDTCEEEEKICPGILEKQKILGEYECVPPENEDPENEE
jgi:hypothetical protein